MNNPYQTPEAELNEGPVTQPEYVGFWARTFASIVDSIALIFLIMAIGSVIWGFDATLAEDNMQSLLFQIVLPIAFVMLFWIIRNATPGKMMINSVIVDAKTGKAPTKGQYVIRYIGYYISSIVLLLGFIWVAFDSRKQGWHDKMAGTVVIKGKAPSSDN